MSSAASYLRRNPAAPSTSAWEMIKTLIFDLGNVIIPFDFGRAYARVEQLTGLDPATIRSRIGGSDLPERLECGRIAPEPFVEELSAVLGFPIGYAEFCELWSSIFFPETLLPESLFESLKGRFRLLVLSNTNPMHFGRIRESYPLVRHFDHYVLSYEVGALKPEPLIYREAIRHARCEPGECFFTDDIPAFVDGARREGIDAVQFKGFEQLREDLQARGIAI